MKKFYKRLSQEGKVMFVDLMVSIILFTLSTPCFFFNLLSIPLGLLVGLSIGWLNYFLLVKQVKEGLSYSKPRLRATLWYFLRYLLYGLGLLIAGLLKYFGYDLINIFAVFGSYFVVLLIVVIFGLKKEPQTQE